MRYTLITLFTIFCSSVHCQDLEGAWTWEETTEGGTRLTGVVTFAGGFQAATWYRTETGVFERTNGGMYSINGTTVTEIIEFDSQNNQRVGSQTTFEIEWDGPNKMRIKGNETWANRIDSGSPGKLAGAWLMSGRKRDGTGEIQQRDTSRPRKTMKILSGTRFQWIAYNTETRQFMGTGGGTYTTVNGKYTENIEFFSRDHSRVGASLPFNFELIEGQWHHSGKSSKGAPLYEIWTTRNQ